MSEAINRIPIECKGDSADVLIYEQIGSSFFEEGVTAKAFAEQLKAFGKGIKTINVRINSPGGSVFDGTAIYNTLRNHGAKIVVHIEGAAISAASLIAMAGDVINIASNGYVMIHNPMSIARGNSDEMRRVAGMLDKITATLVNTYAQRTKQTAEEIAAMMTAETWLVAKEAKEKGFADEITGESKVMASFDPAIFANVPADLVRSFKKGPNMAEVQKPETPAQARAATLAEIEAICKGASPDFVLSQLKVNATLDMAKDAWMAKLTERTEAAEKAAKDATLKADEAEKKVLAAGKKPGVDPVHGDGKNKPATEGEGDPIAEWNEAIDAKVKAGKSRQHAIAAVKREKPEMYQAYIVAYNAANGRRVVV